MLRTILNKESELTDNCLELSIQNRQARKYETKKIFKWNSLGLHWLDSNFILMDLEIIEFLNFDDPFRSSSNRKMIFSSKSASHVTLNFTNPDSFSITNLIVNSKLKNSNFQNSVAKSFNPVIFFSFKIFTLGFFESNGIAFGDQANLI